MNILWYNRSWYNDPGNLPYQDWTSRWKTDGTFNFGAGGFGTERPQLDLHGSLHVVGNIGFTLGIPKNIVQVGAVAVTGTLHTLGNVGYSITVPFPIELPLYINPRGTLGVSGDLGYTINATHPFTQVGAFTLHGAISISGVLGYTLGPAVPKNIVQVGAVGLNGVLKVTAPGAGIGYHHSFEIRTQPMGMLGVLGTLPTSFTYPSAYRLVHLGHMDMFGALVFRDTNFQPIEHITEGLPTGWYTAKYLETVPNPNYGTLYGNHFFTRWTWKGFDPAGTMVAASGSEQDCFSQTLAICQSRHEKWRELAR